MKNRQLEKSIGSSCFTGKDQLFFSLIELLIVISIIAILAAMLLPALNNARTFAWRIGCISNLKEQGKLAQLYSMDYPDYLPPFKYPIPGDVAYYHKTLNRLYGDQKWRNNFRGSIFACPQPHEKNSGTTDKYTAFSYSANYLILCYINDSGVEIRKMKLSAVKRTSATLLYADSFTLNGFGLLKHTNPTLVWADSGQRIGYWHSKGANFAFVDGHVSFLIPRYAPEPNGGIGGYSYDGVTITR